MHALEPDVILGDKYRLIAPLGRGGMGSVWHARHLTLNAPVALKFIGSEQLDFDALHRFLAEARMAAALRSPHVVQILDYGVVDGVPHIAMELLEGEPLAERLAREGQLGAEATARVVQHVARAIGRAHDAGIVHRDLKPENIFIVKNDDDELIKVLDFGIAKANPELIGHSVAVATRSGAFLGTPHYMSPEQVDAGPIDHRTDIWSLGVLAYRCLLGQLPFAGDNVGQLVLAICSRPLPVPSSRGPVPPGFDTWFARACARDPNARFASARQAASDFLVLSTSSAESSSAPSAASFAGATAANGMTSDLGETTGQATNVAVTLPRRARWATRGLGTSLALALLGSVIALVVRIRGAAEPSATKHNLAPSSSATTASAMPSELANTGAPAGQPAATEPSPTAAATSPASARDQGPPARRADAPSEPALPKAARIALRPAPARSAATATRNPVEVHDRAAKPPAPPKGARLERVPDMPPPDMDLGI